jgi:hypothetical protein
MYVKWRRRRHTRRVGYRLGPKYKTFADDTAPGGGRWWAT